MSETLRGYVVGPNAKGQVELEIVDTDTLWALRRLCAGRPSKPYRDEEEGAAGTSNYFGRFWVRPERGRKDQLLALGAELKNDEVDVLVKAQVYSWKGRQGTNLIFSHMERT